MGWGQPVSTTGKRVHSSTHETSSTSEAKTSDSEEVSEPPPYCSKRAREISPELELNGQCNGGTMPECSLVHLECAVNKG